MKALKKILIALCVTAVIIGFLAAIGYGGYRFWANKQKAEEKVRYTESQRGDLKVVLKETATLKPRKTVELKSKVSGRIVDLYYEAGAVVKEGSILAEIDREKYGRDLEIGGQELKRAQQAWDALLPEGEVVTEPEKINAREMNTLVDIVLIDYGAAKINYLNMKEMYARDLISLKALDDAEQAYDSAYVAYHHSVREASKALTEARVNYNQRVEDLSETTIRSPVSGVLTKVLVDSGELVQGTGNMGIGTSIGEAADLSDMLAVVKLNEVDVTKVDLGDPVILTIDSESKTKIRGEVESISPSGEMANNIVTFEVKIKLLDQFAFFKPEMTANADVLVDTATDVVKIPLEAIEEKRGKKEITLLTLKPDAKTESGTAQAEGVEEEEKQDPAEDNEDYYETHFAPKIQYEERKVEVETGLTSELWAEVVRGVTEGVNLKLPDLGMEKKEFGDF